MSVRRCVVALALVAGIGCPLAAPKRKETQMTAKLREIVVKAIAQPEHHAALELEYLRGHDLSGTTQLKVSVAGHYELSSNVTKDEQRRSWSGELAVADRDALLKAIDETQLLDVPSSTRKIHDDEEPIIVTLRYEKLVHQARIWHDDARPSGFYRFEAHINALVKKLSGGEILTIAAE